MAFALDDDANGTGQTETGAENAAPAWLKIGILVAALAVVAGLVLIDTEPRNEQGTAQGTTTSQAPTSVTPATSTPTAQRSISTTTLALGAVGGRTSESSGSATGAPPAFVVRQLNESRSAQSGTLYAVSAFGELVSADLSTGEVSILAENIPTSPAPQILSANGGVVLADATGVRFYESSGEMGPRPVSTSAVDVTSATGLLPFAGLIGFVDRTPAGSRVTVASAAFVADGVILKRFGEFSVPAAAEPLGGSPDTGLDMDLAGQVVRRFTDRTQRLLIGGGGVSLTSNGSQVARLFCDPSSSACSVEVTDFETPTPTAVTFELPVELEGTDRAQLASSAAFSNDGRYLAMIGRIGGLRAVVFDLESEDVHFSPDALGVGDGNGTLTWARDSSVLIYALENEVNSWDMAEAGAGRSSSLGFKRRMIALAAN